MFSQILPKSYAESMGISVKIHKKIILYLPSFQYSRIIKEKRSNKQKLNNRYLISSFLFWKLCFLKHFSKYTDMKIIFDLFRVKRQNCHLYTLVSVLHCNKHIIVDHDRSRSHFFIVAPSSRILQTHGSSTVPMFQVSLCICHSSVCSTFR